jgi:hypothetical protein
VHSPSAIACSRNPYCRVNATSESSVWSSPSVTARSMARPFPQR